MGAAGGGGGWGRSVLVFVYLCTMYFTALLGGRHYKSMILASNRTKACWKLILPQ